MKGAERGNGRGPWTVAVSLRDEVVEVKRTEEEDVGSGDSSRYAEPEAEGVKPVRRTKCSISISYEA